MSSSSFSMSMSRNVEVFLALSGSYITLYKRTKTVKMRIKKKFSKSILNSYL